MIDSLARRLRRVADYLDDMGEGDYEISVVKESADRIELLENALDQLLDDMGADGLCVCQAAKDQAIEALGKTND